MKKWGVVMRMNMRNIQWLPMIASIGIGAAAYSMMTGRGGQLQSFLPMITNMMNQQQNKSQTTNQATQTNQQQNQPNPMGPIAQQAQQNQQQQQRPSVH
ncbi:hypothetical protein [Aquisalibacillus elongatus]|uniref:Uncharacterized protein n=1 Tax=Aquisalibacillus elongatus TaxID=485577 RepID=A0A3N5C9T1_9BACI|nr:hypothetical protein [Aquisalibacillus elongatus]RPF53441.1 hypothetical protein EDC24_1941 [Aquisalibacillus elongatus]